MIINQVNKHVPLIYFILFKRIFERTGVIFSRVNHFGGLFECAIIDLFQQDFVVYEEIKGFLYAIWFSLKFWTG